MEKNALIAREIDNQIKLIDYYRECYDNIRCEYSEHICFAEYNTELIIYSVIEDDDIIPECKIVIEDHSDAQTELIDLDNVHKLFNNEITIEEYIEKITDSITSMF